MILLCFPIVLYGLSGPSVPTRTTPGVSVSQRERKLFLPFVKAFRNFKNAKAMTPRAILIGKLINVPEQVSFVNSSSKFYATMVTPLPPEKDTREEIKTLDSRAVREGTFLSSTQLAGHKVPQQGGKAMLASPASARKSRGLFLQRACSAPTKFSGLDPVPTSDPGKDPLLQFWESQMAPRGGRGGGTGRTGRACTSRKSSLGPPGRPFPSATPSVGSSKSIASLVSPQG